MTWTGNSIQSFDCLVLTLTNRMIEEKEQVNQQIHRIDRIMKLIEMSIDRKNDT